MTAALQYDLVAIGSGPAGQRAAIQAAKLGKRVALAERSPVLGGVSANTGTVPSKTLRSAIVELSALRSRHDVTSDDLMWRTQRVIDHERDVVRDQLRRNGVDVLRGSVSFVDPSTLSLTDVDGSSVLVRASRVVIAVGTVPARPDGVDFDDRTVLDSDGILHLDRVPRTLTVIGGGVIGLEYASMAAALGVHVTLVEKRPRILDFVDGEIAEALQYHLRGLGVTFRLGESVEAVHRVDSGRVLTVLASGKTIPSEVVLYAAGRQGATAGLGLEAAGLSCDARGRIAVDSSYRTSVPGVFAAGDVIGFPALAATSMEQGRLAALAAFDVAPLEAASSRGGRESQVLPYGIYTIPEISFVGPGEEELTRDAVPYVVGMARYRELARGEITGDRSGLLKLLVHAHDRTVLGVHIFGTAATELVHLGQALMAGGIGVDYLVAAVFNVPTFADAYKVAALDAWNRLEELGERAA